MVVNEKTCYYPSIEEEYIKEIKNIPLLSAEEEIELAKKIHISDKYREAFIKSNLRLVAYIARNYKGYGLEFLDLVEEGNIGLIKAVDKFDWTKGYKFSSYAEWWIKQAIKKAIHDKGRAIRIPVNQSSKVCAYKRTFNKLMPIYGSNPPIEMIAEAMQISVAEVEQLRYFNNIINVISLNSTINSDGDEIEKMIPSDTNDLEVADKKMLLEDIVKAMGILTEKEKEVLLHRYGFYDNKPKTLIKTAEIMNCNSHESIRITQQRALTKLKRSHYLKSLL